MPISADHIDLCSWIRVAGGSRNDGIVVTGSIGTAPVIRCHRIPGAHRATVPCWDRRSSTWNRSAGSMTRICRF